MQSCKTFRLILLLVQCNNSLSWCRTVLFGRSNCYSRSCSYVVHSCSVWSFSMVPLIPLIRTISPEIMRLLCRLDPMSTKYSNPLQFTTVYMYLVFVNCIGRKASTWLEDLCSRMAINDARNAVLPSNHSTCQSTERCLHMQFCKRSNTYYLLN